MPTRTMFRGDTLQFPTQVMKVTLQDGTVRYTTQAMIAENPIPSGASAVPMNIGGWFFWFTAKNNVQDPDNQAIVQVTSNNGVVIVNIVTGQIQVTAQPLATIGFADSEIDLPYDIQGKDLNGNIFTVERGTLAVQPDITRAII